MIAKTAFLLLGMISEGPKGAYEINKLLDQMDVKWWLTISNSAVYTTIRNLEKKEYVTGHGEKNGNMPERTVYEITAKGLEVFKESLCEAFCTMDFDTTIFSIATIYIQVLEKKELKELIQKRCLILAEYKQGIEQKKESLRPYVDSHILLDLDRMLQIIDVELVNAEAMTAFCQ